MFYSLLQFSPKRCPEACARASPEHKVYVECDSFSGNCDCMITGKCDSAYKFELCSSL